MSVTFFRPKRAIPAMQYDGTVESWQAIKLWTGGNARMIEGILQVHGQMLKEGNWILKVSQPFGFRVVSAKEMRATYEMVIG